MDQNKVTLCWPNRIDQSALTGGAWLPQLPVTNMQDRILAKKARTTGLLGSTYGMTNLILQSQAFDNASWTKVGTTVLPNSYGAPDGTTTADLIVEAAGTTGHYFSSAVTKAAANVLMAFSIYALPNGRSNVILRLDGNDGNVISYNFNIITGTINPLATSGTPLANPTATITAAAGGYYRCSISGVTSTTTSIRALISLAQNDAQTVTPTYAGDTARSVAVWGAQLEANSFATPYLATTTSAASTPALNSRFDIGLDKSRPIAALALAAHNLSSNAKIRVRFYSDYAKAYLLWDSGEVSAWPAFYITEQLEWGDNNFWFGNNALDPAADYTPLFTLFADAVYTAQLVSVEIIDPLNAAGYVEVGRAFVSTVWQPQINMQYEPQHGYINTTAIEEALDQTEYFDRKRQRRTATFTLGALTVAEAFGSIYSMQRDLGVDKEILYAYALAPTAESYYRTFLARNQKIDALSQPYLDRHKGALYLQEIL